jgi:L-ascorbate metabolism protein UlaG (beta-lactamase superfamily)
LYHNNTKEKDMEISYLGHACFLANIDGIKILFDPYISKNPMASEIDLNKIMVDFILVSHGHEDHILDVISIAKQNNAMIICNHELSLYFQSKGIENTHAMNIGGEWHFAFGRLKYLHAAHSSQLPNGLYGGHAGAFLIESAAKTFYYAGDTGLSYEMKLLEKESLDFAILPIGGNYTMNVEDAIIASDFIGCDKIIGMHYDTFAHITIDKESAVDMFSERGKELFLPNIGKTIEL